MRLWARALPIIGATDSPETNWTRSDASPALPWPRNGEVVVRGSWDAGDVPVGLVEDERIMRTYFVAEGKAGVALLSAVVAAGAAAQPGDLIGAARSASGWGALGDTLYDVIAGCVDPRDREIVEVWDRRARDEHPLIRLAAAWTGPYFQNDQVVPRLETLASADPEPQVRSAAQESLAFLRDDV